MWKSATYIHIKKTKQNKIYINLYIAKPSSQGSWQHPRNLPVKISGVEEIWRSRNQKAGSPEEEKKEEIRRIRIGSWIAEPYAQTVQPIICKGSESVILSWWYDGKWECSREILKKKNTSWERFSKVEDYQHKFKM